MNITKVYVLDAPKMAVAYYISLKGGFCEKIGLSNRPAVRWLRKVINAPSEDVQKG